MLIICIFLFFICCYFLKLSKNKSLLLSVGIIFLVELCWALISCLYLDFTKAYIIETGQTSYFTGAFFRMLLLYLPFILILSSKSSGKLNKYYSKPLYFMKINSNICIRYILFFTLGIVCYCILDMFISGIPLFSTTIGRHNFSKYTTLPFAMKINGEITYFGVLIAGLAFFNGNNKTNKTLSKLILILSLIFRFMMEYKYHGMYNIFYAFFLPGLINWYKKNNYHILSIRTIFKCLTILSVVLLLSYYTYSNINKSFDAKNLLFDRIFALQSHTFWGMDERAFVLDNNINGYKESLNAEIDAVFNGLGEMDTSSGIINVMYKVANRISVDENIKNGVRWAGSFLTVGINTIGYLATFLLSIILGIIVLFDFKLMFSAMQNHEYILLYFSQSLMWDLLDYFRVGNWCILLNSKTVIVFIFLLFIYLMKKRSTISIQRYMEGD